ncbi:hypothetical protein L9F63_027776, partial [Diploptera punctata]
SMFLAKLFTNIILFSLNRFNNFLFANIFKIHIFNNVEMEWDKIENLCLSDQIIPGIQALRTRGNMNVFTLCNISRSHFSTPRFAVVCIEFI